LGHTWITELAKTTVDESIAIGALNNLKNFRADQTLKSATYSYIATQMLSKTKKEELAKVFKAFDKNGDGRLSMDEVKQGYLDHYGKVVSDDEVEKMFKSVDSDNSGFIDYTEFVVAAINEQEMTTNEFLQAAFKMFDKDGNGFITPDEVKQVMNEQDSQFTDAELKQMFDYVDKDGDQQISYPEFVKMCTGEESPPVK